MSEMKCKLMALIVDKSVAFYPEKQTTIPFVPAVGMPFSFGGIVANLEQVTYCTDTQTWIVKLARADFENGVANKVMERLRQEGWLDTHSLERGKDTDNL